MKTKTNSLESSRRWPSTGALHIARRMSIRMSKCGKGDWCVVIDFVYQIWFAIACIVMAYIVMAYIVVAYIVMAWTRGSS